MKENWKWIVLFFAVLAVSYAIMKISRKKLNLCFSIFILVWGIIYGVLITPFSPNDELAHYNATYYYSMKLFPNASKNYLSPDDFTIHLNSKKGFEKILFQLQNDTYQECQAPTLEDPQGLSSLLYFLEYVPQTIGLSIGRIFNLRAAVSFYLGRFTNLLFFAFMVYLTISIVPEHFAIPIGLTALLPITLQQVSSYSYDCFIFSFVFLFLAQFFRLCSSDDRINKKEYIFLLLTAVLLAPAKGLYALLIFLFPIIDEVKFASARQKKRLFIVLLSSCIVVFALFSAKKILSLDLSAEPKANEVKHYSLTYFSNHFNSLLKIIWNTKSSVPDWITQIFGRKLSGLSLFLPNYIAIILAANIFISSQSAKIPEKLSLISSRIIMLSIIIAIVIGFMATVLLTYTSFGSQSIVGVQGRYFTPLVPLFFVASLLPRRLLKRMSYNFQIPANLYIANIILANCMNVVVIRIVLFETLAC